MDSADKRANRIYGVEVRACGQIWQFGRSRVVNRFVRVRELRNPQSIFRRSNAIF